MTNISCTGCILMVWQVLPMRRPNHLDWGPGAFQSFLGFPSMETAAWRHGGMMDD